MRDRLPFITSHEGVSETIYKIHKPGTRFKLLLNPRELEALLNEIEAIV